MLKTWDCLQLPKR